MSAVACTVHLVTLQPGHDKDDFLASLNDPTLLNQASYLLKGKAHGWVHQPHRSGERNRLLAREWQYFLLTRQQELPGPLGEIVGPHMSVDVSIPKAQHDNIVKNRRSEPVPETPPLPDEWPGDGGIPGALISDDDGSSLKVGELRLDRTMADFLTTALPDGVQNAPVSLMNFFKYPGDDSSVHDAYMEGFKNNFGNAAGATVKYMGPVRSSLRYSNDESSNESTEGERGAWNDANLVQYDTIWHYAYMLSTDVYAELNKQKIAGLEDTCILLVSEMELAS